MTFYGYIVVDSCIIPFNLNCIMQFKQFFDIATKVSSRKKCYYFWWSPWLLSWWSSSPLCLRLSLETDYTYTVPERRHSRTSWPYAFNKGSPKSVLGVVFQAVISLDVSSHTVFPCYIVRKVYFEGCFSCPCGELVVVPNRRNHLNFQPCIGYVNGATSEF